MIYGASFVQSDKEILFYRGTAPDENILFKAHEEDMVSLRHVASAILIPNREGEPINAYTRLIVDYNYPGAEFLPQRDSQRAERLERYLALEKQNLLLPNSRLKDAVLRLEFTYHLPIVIEPVLLCPILDMSPQIDQELFSGTEGRISGIYTGIYAAENLPKDIEETIKSCWREQNSVSFSN